MSEPTLHINRRYTLHAKLGQGGMGVVYRAYDRLNRQMVALKQVGAPAADLHFATAGSDLALALEFRMLAGLRHPNIVSVLDYGFDRQGFPYYTMHLIEDAQTLTAYARQLDDAGKVRLVIEMLHALVYLHRRGIIHRDLKPGNLLVTPNGSVKVLDFGLALQRESSAQYGESLAGTLAYMAPELFEQSPPTVAADLYAVGVILYEVFVGQPPFSSTNPAALLMQIVTKLPDLSPLPPHLALVVGRLLLKDPTERYSSAADVIDALCAAVGTPPPVESALLRESFLQASAFVGREAETATLTAALNDASDMRGSFWLIGGESGVGKIGQTHQK